MRLLVVASLAALLAVPTFASAGTAVSLGPSGAVLVTTDTLGHLVVWPATPGAYAYEVFLVQNDGSASHLGTTSTPTFLDQTTEALEPVYRILPLVHGGEGRAFEIGTRGECVSRRGTDVAITVGNCTEPVLEG